MGSLTSAVVKIYHPSYLSCKTIHASRRSLDKDKDGAITTNELQKALAGLGVPVDEQMAAQMVELIDIDHSSDISYEEFRRFALLLPSSQVRCIPLLTPSQWSAECFPSLLHHNRSMLELVIQVNGASIVLDWMDCASWADGVEYRLGARMPPREPFQRFIAGGIAGAFSRTGECTTCMTFHVLVLLLKAGMLSQMHTCTQHFNVCKETAL